MKRTLHPSSFRLGWLLLVGGLLAACEVPDSGAIPATPITNPTVVPLSMDAGAIPTDPAATPTFPPPTPDTRTDNANPSDLTDIDGTLYFTAYRESGSYKLWKSDGTAGGTRNVVNSFPGQANAYPGHLTNVAGTIFFVTYGDPGHRSWKLDGTKLAPLDVLPPFYRSAGTRELTFFFGRQADGPWELWKSAGTADGTVLVKDLNQKPGPALTPGPMPTPSIGFIP